MYSTRSSRSTSKREWDPHPIELLPGRRRGKHDAGANSNGIVDPNVDAIAELKMETSSTRPSLATAGAVINVVTKSGTKNFHGTLFEFVRNDAFDARRSSRRSGLAALQRFANPRRLYSSPASSTAIAISFSSSSARMEVHAPGTDDVNTVPTAAERAGDFSNSSLPAPVDPTPGRLPESDGTPVGWSKNGAALLKPYPLPNFFGPAQLCRHRHRQDRLSRRAIAPRLQHLAETQLSYRFTHDKWYLVFPFRNNTLDSSPIRGHDPDT